MTRKDYELIAQALKAALEEDDVYILNIRLVAEQLATRLQMDNPNFDPKRFYEACGL